MIRDWSKASIMVEGTWENYPQAFTSKPTASFPVRCLRMLNCASSPGIHLCQPSDWGTIYSEWQRQGVGLSWNAVLMSLHPDIWTQIPPFQCLLLLSSPQGWSPWPALRFHLPESPPRAHPRDQTPTGSYPQAISAQVLGKSNSGQGLGPWLGSRVSSLSSPEIPASSSVKWSHFHPHWERGFAHFSSLCGNPAPVDNRVSSGEQHESDIFLLCIS